MKIAPLTGVFLRLSIALLHLQLRRVFRRLVIFAWSFGLYIGVAFSCLLL